MDDLGVPPRNGNPCIWGWEFALAEVHFASFVGVLVKVFGLGVGSRFVAQLLHQSYVIPYQHILYINIYQPHQGITYVLGRFFLKGFEWPRHATDYQRWTPWIPSPLKSSAIRRSSNCLCCNYTQQSGIIYGFQTLGNPMVPHNRIVNIGKYKTS